MRNSLKDKDTAVDILVVLSILIRLFCCFVGKMKKKEEMRYESRGKQLEAMCVRVSLFLYHRIPEPYIFILLRNRLLTLL